MTAKQSYGVGSGTALDEFTAPPCAQFTGYHLLSVDREAQSIRVQFTATEAMLNPGGTIQGGFLTAMLDEVMGSMIVILSGGEKYPSSIDIHTQYFRPVSPGGLVGEARVTHMGKSTVFTTATLFNEAGEAVAAATQAARMFPMKRPDK